MSFSWRLCYEPVNVQPVRKPEFFFTNATRKASRKNVSHTSCRRSSLPLAKMAEKLVVRERLLNRLWVPYAPDEDIHAPYMAKYVKYF